MDKKDILKALEELRKQAQRKFVQTVELIINLRNFDIKRQNVNLLVNVPYKIKDKKICAFLSKKSEVVDTLTKKDFPAYKDKKAMKKLVRNYDFFISIPQLMPDIATAFGKALGPAGKMPSPQLGIITNEDDKSIQALLTKINQSVKVKSKEPSLKVVIGKEDMKDQELAENVLAIFNAVYEALPRKKENLRSILIKFTMSKPIKIALK